MAEGTRPLPPEPTPNPAASRIPPDIDDAAHAARQPAAAARAVAKPPPKRKRRRWPYVIVSLLVVLVLLVLLAPTLAGTGPVRSIIVGQVNQRINGRINLGDLSMGWTSPVSLSGLKVFDKGGAQVLEVGRVTTELTLLDAVRGKLHFGKVTVDGLNALVRRDAQGNVNLNQIAPSAPHPAPPPRSGPAKLPDLSGELHLVNCRATFEDQVQAQTFFFPTIQGVVKVPDINGAVENALEVTCKVGNSPPGKLTLNGKADVVENNVVNVDKADVDEKVTFQDVELGGFSFALGKDAALQKLAGRTNGAVSLRYRGGEGAGVEMQVDSTGFAAGGPALKGDTFATQKLSVVVPPTTLAMPGGSSDWKSWSLRVGSSGGPSDITLTLDQGTVAIGADAPLAALSNLGQNLPPGAPGQIRTNVNLDVGALARQLPHVLAVQEGLTLSSGRLTQLTDVQLAADRATVRRLEAHLTDVKGQRGTQPVSLDPIDVAFTAATFGGGWAAPNVRDLNLTLASGFANARFTGADVASLAGDARGELKRATDQLGQVFDLGKVRLEGAFDVQLASKGNVAAGENATVNATVTISNLLYGLADDKPPLRQERVQLTANGEIVRRPDGSVGQVRGGKVVATSGAVARPTVSATINVPSVVMAPPAPTTGAASRPSAAGGVASATYEIPLATLDLARARVEFGPYVAALQEYAFDRGAINATAAGKYENGGLTFDGRVTLNDVWLAVAPQATPPAAPVQVLRGFNLTTDTAFAYAPTAGGSQLDVTRLVVADGAGMLSVKKSPDQPLRIVTTAAGTVPSGRLDVSADLKQLNDIRTNLAVAGAAAPAATAPDSTQLRSGKIAGTIDVAQAAQGEFRINSNLQGSQLTVGGPRGDVLSNEGLTIAAQVRAKQDMSAATVDQLNVAGNLLTADVTGTTLVLKVGQGATARAATPVEMVQSATAKVQVPDLGKIQALKDALSPPEPAAAPSARARGFDRVPALEAAFALADEGNAGAGSNAAPVLLALAPPPDQIIGRRPGAQPQRAAQPVPAPAPANPPAGTPAPPAAPLKITGGSAALSLTVRRENGRVVINPDLTAKGVTLAKGAGGHTLDAVDFKTTVSFVPVPPPAAAAAPAAPGVAATPATQPSIAAQMRDLQVPNLTLHAAGSTVTLAEPVVISDPDALGRLFSPPADRAAARPAADASVKAALRGEGDVGQLSSLLVALGMIGDPSGPKQPYTGRYDLDERLAAGNGGLTATGKLNLTDFVAAGSSFNEKAIRFANDLTLDSAKDALSIRSVTLGMESTKALELKLAGNILDYSTQRRFDNFAGTVGYDWAKLWEIVKPMLSKEQQQNLDLKIAGQAQRQFALSGSYPAVGAGGKPLPFNEAIKSLSGYFDGGFQVVEINGLQVQNLELPLTLRGGRLVVAYHDKPQGQNVPPPADCNGGKLTLGGATVDLTDPAPRLTIAKGTKLLSNATLNPVFADKFGAMINNPLFVDPKEARGLVDVTVVECNRLPLDALVLKSAPQNDGRAEFLFSIREVFLGNSTLMEALKLAGQTEFAGSLQGEIRESRVIIERGQTRQDVTINTGQGDRPFRIQGSTSLQTSALNLTFTLPPQLLRQLGPTGKQAAELLPDGVPIPLGGTTRAPQLDLSRALTSAVKEGLLPGLLRRATGGNKTDNRATNPPRDGSMQPGQGGQGGSPGGNAPPPATEPPAGADPLKDLFDLIGKQKQQKDKEKQDQRDRRQQR